MTTKRNSKVSNLAPFAYVAEYNDAFLALFPHRFDYLYADHPSPGAPPQWLTENKHPLADRQIRQGAFLYGVRFGQHTNYALLDIDAGSIYHPKRDPFAVGRIAAALEPLGLCSYLAVTSSYTGGVHIYFPFAESCKSWELAAAIGVVLENGGFKIESGLLEIFPNQRNYDPESNTLYKGHRLPLQAGSYLLNQDWQLCNTSPEFFVSQWNRCMSKNDVQVKAIRRAVASARRKFKRLTFKASKFLNDLNTDIDSGWTAHGQTNHLLGRITLRSYVFGHVLDGTDPKEGDRLTAEIVAAATQLPGYKDWCRHQTEIWRRAEEWARCVEASHYWHYRIPKQSPSVPVSAETGTSNTWNRFQQEKAREKLREAIADLLNKGQLPSGARDRFLLLTKRYEIGGETVYRHRDLWHPDCLWKTPPDPPTELEATPSELAWGSSEEESATSLFTNSGGNTSQREEYRLFLKSIFAETGGNSKPSEGFSDLSSAFGVDSG